MVVTDSSGGSKQVDGAVELRVLNEEVGTSLQQQRIRSFIERLGDHVQRGVLLAAERQLQRLGEVARLVHRHTTPDNDHRGCLDEQAKCHHAILVADRSEAGRRAASSLDSA